MQRLIDLANKGWEVSAFFRQNYIQLQVKTGINSYNVQAGTDYEALVEQLLRNLPDEPPVLRQPKPSPQEITFEFLFGQTDR